MPFGPKRTAGISGHYSEAQSGSHRETRKWVESSGSQWETSRRSGRLAEASGRPGRGWKRSGKLWERAEEVGGLGKVTVCYILSSDDIEMLDFGLAKDARSVKNNNETYPDTANESDDLDSKMKWVK